MTTLIGSVSKASSDYVKALEEEIAGDRDHPRHHGVKMQAHHLISEKGISISGLGDELKSYGYFINNVKNLVFLPCTLKGACHLGVQVHRGDHRAPVDQDKPDNDRDKTPTYHTKVADALADLKGAFTKECSAGHIDKVIGQVHRVSHTMLIKIQRGSVPLTSAADHFKPGSSIGCGGFISIPDLNRSPRPCPAGRKHLGRHGTDKDSENITYSGPVPYKLEPGK